MTAPPPPGGHVPHGEPAARRLEYQPAAPLPNSPHLLIVRDLLIILLRLIGLLILLWGGWILLDRLISIIVDWSRGTLPISHPTFVQNLRRTAVDVASYVIGGLALMFSAAYLVRWLMPGRR